jgi:hypothetical protein
MMAARNFLDLLARRCGTDHHAVATALVRGLHNKVLEILENEGAVGIDRRKVGLDIRQDGLLAEVEVRSLPAT